VSLLERVNTKPEIIDDGTVDTEGSHLDEDASKLLDENLDEMMGNPRRYVNPRDLQYHLEDAATTCERMWADARRYKKDKQDKHKGAHDALVSALRDAAAKAKALADARDKDMQIA
jgi:hypothetical protein